MNNWFDYILFHIRSQPETPAMVMEDRTVTYGMLGTAIASCARRIAALKIQPDGLVAVQIENPIRDLTISLALFRIGMRSISLTQGHAGIEGVAFSAVLGDRDAARLFDPGAGLIEVTDEWFSEQAPVDGILPHSFFAGGQTCRLSLTSGSTGTPKVVNHRVVDVGQRAFKFMGMNWTFALCMPGLSSSIGFTTACMTLAAGRTLCFAKSPFQAIRMTDLFSIDFIRCSTEQLAALTRAARKSRAHLRSLRTVWVGGGVPTRALLEAAMIHLCKDVYCTYGASETGTIAGITAREVLPNPGLVGHILPGVEVGIFDANDKRCSVGETGTVKIRRHDDKLVQANVEKPWIDIGDVGWIASDSYLHILGRAGDADGPRDTPAQRVSPVHEVEHLLRLEWDVNDAAAVLVEDKSSEKPQIWIGVVGNRDLRAEKVAAIARVRGIEHIIRLCDLTAIPRGANGKVNRAQLKTLLLAAMPKPTAS
jgi:acyl-coenzyme A synthetase/AMP-(fatty) acid ligase